MATQIWRGDAVAVAQVNTVTPASVTVGNTFTLTINGKTVVFTATAATVANVTAGLTEAVNNSDIPEFSEVTATDGTTVLTLTADTPGQPFTQTSSAAVGSGSGTPTLGTSTTTASAGPNDWSTAANWSTGSVPTSSDTVYVENSSSSILYGLSQSSVTLTALNVAASFTGQIGLPDVTATGYYEYRDKYLAISATTVNIGQGAGGGSGRIKLDVGSNAATFNVSGTGSPADQAVPALMLKGTHASNVLNATQGTVGVAYESGSTSTLATVRVGFEQSPATDVALTLGAGCTLTTINQAGGVVTVNSNVTTWTMTGGTGYLTAGAVTTLTIEGGTVYWESTGTITTAVVGSDAALDASRDLRPRTVTNLTIQGGGTVRDSFKTVTFTNPFALDHCSLAEVTLDLGSGFNLQRS